MADGRVKILDFGVAALMQSTVSSEDVTELADRLTGVGSAVGTVGYMSPEQVRGLPTDGRSDIFSFGTVLFEVLAGRQPFRGDTAADTTSAILREDPPPLTDARVPPVLDRIIRRCLEKSPKLRYQSADDLAFTLEAISGTTTGSVVSVVDAPGHRRWPAVLAGTFAVSTVLLALPFLLTQPSADPSQYRFTPFATDPEFENHSAWSPDGRSIAFGKDVDGNAQIFVRSVDSDSIVQLTHGAVNAAWPFWWPDASRLGYLADEQVWSLSRAGGEQRMDPMARPSKYSPEVRERAVRMVYEHTPEHASQWAAIRSIAEKLGCTAETLRRWVRQAERDARPASGPDDRRARASSSELEREVVELKRANEILRKASAFFARRSSTADRSDGGLHRSAPRDVRGRADLRGAADRPVDVFPAESAQAHDPTTRSARAQRDEELRADDSAGLGRAPSGVRRHGRSGGSCGASRSTSRAARVRAADARHGAARRRPWPRLGRHHAQPTPPRPVRPTSWSASLRRRGRISSGSRTSPTWRRGAGSCMSPS